MPDAPILQRMCLLSPRCRASPQSRSAARGRVARGTTPPYDIGLYDAPGQPLDTGRLLLAVRTFADAPDAAQVTPIVGWGPWIVGGGWLTVAGCKIYLLSRNSESSSAGIGKCREAPANRTAY